MPSLLPDLTRGAHITDPDAAFRAAPDATERTVAQNVVQNVTPTPAPDTLDGLFVVVLARNEARRLVACLDSCRFAQRTVVIDAGSSDDTVALARSRGAQVHSHPDWHGFGVQRTRSLRYCRDARYLFFLDADEQMTPALRDEIAALVRAGTPGAWTVRWEQVAFGRALTHMTSAPGMPRLFSAGCLRGFEGAVHEQALLAPGTPVRALKARLRHHSYDSVRLSLQKISQYALLGAAKRAARGQRGGVWRGLASASALFARLYVLRGGFLHGGAGFLYCYVLAQECFFRYAALQYDRDTLTEAVARER